MVVNMDMLARLKATGGPPDLRRQIFQFLDSIKIQHSGSIFTARAVFAIIEKLLQENKTPEHEILFQSLQEILDGSVRSTYVIDHLYHSSLSLLGELNDRNIPWASALVEVVDDHERGVDLAPVAGEGDGHEGERVPDCKLIRRIVFVLILFALIGELSGSKQHDPPRILQDPDLIHLPPETPMRAMPSAAPSDNYSQTMYIGGLDAFRAMLEKFGLEMEEENVDMSGFEERHMVKSGRTLKERHDFRIISGVQHQDQDDAHDVEIVSWFEYITRLVDPVYLPSGRQLRLHHSRPPWALNLLGSAMGGTLTGYYNTASHLLWAESPGVFESTKSRLRVIYVVAHELTHMMHLGYDFIAGDCLESDRLCKYIIKGDDSKKIPSDKVYLALTRAQPLVDLVLYMGYRSDEMSFAEAVLINNAILDMRLKHIYLKAMESDVYKKSWTYYSVNAAEFFAEASSSFLGFDRFSSFPSRDWIAKNDPPLFSLLRQVWAGAKPEDLPSEADLQPTTWEQDTRDMT